jgi:hypothetical protein
MSLLCEWSWAIRLSAASFVLGAHYSTHANAGLERKNIGDGNCPSPGLYTTIRSLSVNLVPFFLTGSSVIMNINNTRIS